VTEASLLEVTAEISVAFAGFIGIFLVLATREGRFPGGAALTIRTIVICSVGPVFYSALPLVLHALGVSGPPLWQVSSLAVGLIAVAATAYMARYSRTVPHAERWPFLSFQNLVGSMFAAVMFTCHFGNALAWPWAPSGGVYLLAIWSTVAIAGTNFVELIFREVL